MCAVSATLQLCQDGGTGIHARLKILWPLAMRVRSRFLLQISFFLAASMGFCTISFLDLVACTGSSLAVTSLLPQIIQSYRTKSVKDIFVLMILNLTVSSVSRTLYGIVTADKPLFLTNLLLTIGSLVMGALKRKYHSAKRP